MSEVDLAALADAGAFVSHEHQAHLAEAVGVADWRIDAAAGVLAFRDRAGEERRVRAHLVGSSSPDDGTWLWGWTNVNGFPPAFVKQSERVRALGERYGIPELTTGTLPLDDGLPPRLLQAVKAVTGVTAHFSAPTGNGATRAYLLLDDPTLALPAPTVARAVAVVTSALAGGGPVDHRRALTAWAEQRGATRTAVDDDVDELVLDDGSLQVRFDGGGRIAGLGRRLRGRGPAAVQPVAEPQVEVPPAIDDPAPEPPAAAAPEAEEPRRRGWLQRLLGT
jgi:hypothetical protein